MDFKQIKSAIKNDPENRQFTMDGWEPIYTAYSTAKILIIGQAPGRITQETGIPWNDASGENLRKWLKIDRSDFYNKEKFAIIPMDFYFPGASK